MSRYVELSLLDSEGNPRPIYKIKGAGSFVEAVHGEQYGIRMRNKSETHARALNVYVDGNLVHRPCLVSHSTFDLTEVVSKVLTVAGVTKKVYQPLTFACPEIKEGGEDLPDDVAERLGCIEIQVFEAEKRDAAPFNSSVVTQESLKVAMSEEQAIMKGAFRSVTTLGATERVKTLDAPETSSWYKGKHLGDVKLGYGSRAMLLFKGVPPPFFIMSSKHQTTADDDDEADDDEDEDDEQSEGDPEPRNGGRKRGRASGPVSRPPPGPQLSRKALNKKLKSED